MGRWPIRVYSSGGMLVALHRHVLRIVTRKIVGTQVNWLNGLAQPGIQPIALTLI